MAITYEQLKGVNDVLNKIDVKGKGYVQVNDRIKGFRQLFPMGCIETEIIELGEGVVTMKAIVSDGEGHVLGTGLAQEKESSSFINKTSFIENCETSAVGRALGFAGIGVDGSMASADEVANAILQQKEAKDPKKINEKAYPSNDEMIKAIAKKYPAGSDNLKALLATFQVEKLEDATDVQLQAVYNKVSKK